MNRLALFGGSLLALMLIAAGIFLLNSFTGTPETEQSNVIDRNEPFPTDESERQQAFREPTQEELRVSQPQPQSQFSSPSSEIPESVSSQIDELKSFSNEFSGLNNSASQLDENVEL